MVASYIRKESSYWNLADQYTEAPYIARAPTSTLSHPRISFWRHIQIRSQRSRIVYGVPLRLFRLSRYTKVTHLGPFNKLIFYLLDQDVLRFYIPMNNSTPVQICYTSGDISKNSEFRIAGLQKSPAACFSSSRILPRDASHLSRMSQIFLWLLQYFLIDIRILPMAFNVPNIPVVKVNSPGITTVMSRE